MAKIYIKKGAYVAYQRTTYQGEVEIAGEEIIYRWSEDDNGAEMYVLLEGNWKEVNTSEGNYAVLYAAIMEWGNPEEFGDDNDTIDLDESIIEDYI
tara:strand:- start:2500 stop:2787 length:288 start_codon:yes stop_codon:yes gene_type:complete